MNGTSLLLDVRRREEKGREVQRPEVGRGRRLCEGVVAGERLERAADAVDKGGFRGGKGKGFGERLDVLTTLPLQEDGGDRGEESGTEALRASRGRL